MLDESWKLGRGGVPEVAALGLRESHAASAMKETSTTWKQRIYTPPENAWNGDYNLAGASNAHAPSPHRPSTREREPAVIVRVELAQPLLATPPQVGATSIAPRLGRPDSPPIWPSTSPTSPRLTSPRS